MFHIKTYNDIKIHSYKDRIYDHNFFLMFNLRISFQRVKKVILFGIRRAHIFCINKNLRRYKEI